MSKSPVVVQLLFSFYIKVLLLLSVIFIALSLVDSWIVFIFRPFLSV